MEMDDSKKTSIVKAQLASKDPKHDKHWRIHNLPPEVYERTYSMLRMHSPRTVAELLQEEGFHKDIQPVTLSHILEQFRREKIPVNECISPYLVEKLTSRLKTNVNCFVELSDLISLQKERVRSARLSEIDSESLNPEVNKQMHLMSRMLKIYGDMAVKTGLMSSFVSQFSRECQQEEDGDTFEVKYLFYNALRRMGIDSPEKLESLFESQEE